MNAGLPPCSVAGCPWAAGYGVLPWRRAEGRWAPGLALCGEHLHAYHVARIRGEDIKITIRGAYWVDPYLAAVELLARRN